MTIAFLIPQDSYESEHIKKELSTLGKENISILKWDSVVHPITEFPEVLWVRFSPKYPIIFQMATIEEFESKGTRVVNSKGAIETCDKMSTFLFWKRHLQEYIHMPNTIVTRNIEEAYKFTQKGECIFKPISLGLGQGIQRVVNNPKLKETLQSLLDEYGLLFLQEYIPNLGFDIRAIVIERQNIIEYTRQNPQDFRYNIHLGGIIKAVSIIKLLQPVLLEKLRHIARIIAQKTQLDMVGIDFLVSEKGELVLLEWNAFFNFQGAENALQVNIAKKIAEFLCKLDSS
ncbi:MAG TPA: hypothetical protein VMV49_14255 [Candidatus Deferrimicrobium sp.]|nr:hypothetical protein [Candidatus Deferrimicrobium sp.]